MKKLRLIIAAVLFTGFAAILSVSCKSQALPGKNVNPLDLLDNKSAWYFAIPKSQDITLVQKMLQSNMNNLSEKDSLLVAERIDTVYAGLTKKKKSTDFQVSASCSIPKIAVNKVFTKKNGWNPEKITLNNSSESKEYTVFNQNDLHVSLPDTHTALLGRNIPDMLEKYDCLSAADLVSEEKKSALESQSIDPLIYEWLNNNDGEVRFFANQPHSFLTMLTGAIFNLKLIYVRGSMVTDPKKKDAYLMDLEFEFRESKTVPAAKGILVLAFGLTNSQVTLETPTHIKIKNIEVGKKQLYKLLVI